MGRNARLRQERKAALGFELSQGNPYVEHMRRELCPLHPQVKGFLVAEEFLRSSTQELFSLCFLDFEDFWDAEVLEKLDASEDYCRGVSHPWSSSLFFLDRDDVFWIQMKSDREPFDGIRALFSADDEIDAMIAESRWKTVAKSHWSSIIGGAKTLLLTWKDVDNFGFYVPSDKEMEFVCSSNSALSTRYKASVASLKRDGSFVLFYQGADRESGCIILNLERDYSFLGHPKNLAWNAVVNGLPLYESID